MIERELKYLISEQQYLLYQKKLVWDEVVEQINYYFFDKKNEDVTIRVREKGKKLYLQVKVPLSEQDGIHVKKEFSREISDIPNMISSTELMQLTEKKLYSASYIGKLKTTRYKKIFDQAEVCLDKNEYLGIVDYEVEIEYLNKEALENCLTQMKAFGFLIENKSVSGKFTRFKIRKENNDE